MVPEVLIVPEVPMVLGVPRVHLVLAVPIYGSWSCLIITLITMGPMIPLHSLNVYLKTQFFLLQCLDSHYLLGHMLH